MPNKDDGTPVDVITEVMKFSKSTPGNMFLTILAIFGMGAVAKNIKGK